MNNFIYDTPTKVYFGKDEELKIERLYLNITHQRF